MKFKRILISGEAIVVTFDMCSSSDILEELILLNDLSPYERVITKLKHYLAEAQEWVLFDPYKFTGDGWILLFPGNTSGASLWKLIAGLSACYRATSEVDLLPRLNTHPSIVGLTFGIEKGPIAHMTIFQQKEYVGRPITVACRLQAAIKSVTSKPAYKALISRSAYDDIFAKFPKIGAINRKVSLHNIRGGRTFRCKLIRTFPSSSEGNR